LTTLGNHSKLQIAKKYRELARRFYIELLNCRTLPAPNPDFDIYQMEDGFVVGIFFVDDALSPSFDDYLNVTWLELMTPDPSALQARVLSLGLDEIDYWDKNHFYFHSPGGPVFRIAHDSERIHR